MLPASRIVCRYFALTCKVIKSGDLAGCAYLWRVAMDSERPDVAIEAREFLVALHLDLSDELQEQQALVRSTLIK